MNARTADRRISRPNEPDTVVCENLSAGTEFWPNFCCSANRKFETAFAGTSLDSTWKPE